MGKRSNFVRFDRDYYTTPVEGVIPLLPHIMGKIQRFAEPCAGNGALIDHIEGHDFFSLEKNNPVCVYASDIEPQRKDIIKKNALKLTRNDAVGETTKKLEVFLSYFDENEDGDLNFGEVWNALKAHLKLQIFRYSWTRTALDGGSICNALTVEELGKLGDYLDVHHVTVLHFYISGSWCEKPVPAR